MISSSYRLQGEKVEADVIPHPKRSRLLGLLGRVLPEEDHQVCITGQLLHPLSAFVPDVVDLLPERTHTDNIV